jgi:hypothetical protein
MLALELAMGFLFGFGLFQRNDLRLGQHQALLGALGFQRLEPFLHGLQVVTEPHAAHAGGTSRSRRYLGGPWHISKGNARLSLPKTPSADVTATSESEHDCD